MRGKLFFGRQTPKVPADYWGATASREGLLATGRRPDSLGRYWSSMSLDQFFSRYAELSMGPQPEALAGLYAPTFIVGGPEGSHAFANDSHFLEWLGQVAAFNREHGMRNLAAVSIEGMELSPVHTLATVRWGARFDKTGDRTIEFAISYLLERSNGDWRILSYISRTDQNAEMAKEGLL